MAPEIMAPETIGAMLARNAARFGPHAVCAERRAGRYVPMSWLQLLDDACAFARFLAAAGVGVGSRVAVISRNRADMITAELATMSSGAIFVPIFAGYSSEQTAELLAHAEPAVVVLQRTGDADRIRIPSSTRSIVSFEPEPAGETRVVAFRDVIRTFTPSAAERRAFVERSRAADPFSPCLMMYTSGTSGALKGVLLTHDNILSQRRAIAERWHLTTQDRFLSYLPWHHSFGGIFEKHTALYNGATIYIDDSMGRDFPTLLRNFVDVRPTIYFSVPKIYQQLVAHAQTHPDDEVRIFHDRLRFVFTAAAPLPANVSQYFADKRVPVIEGWGLTETSPCCTLTDPTEPRSMPGLVGYAIPGVSLHIASDGEVLVRGPNVMAGYFKDDAATARALPADRWFHTGDLGELHDGALRLIGRKDRVFKMLNAEKVVPTDLENRLLGMNRFIRHVIVAGDGRNFVTALVFPDFFRITEEFGSDRARAEREVKASLIATIREFNRTHPVKYEHIEACAVISKELSIEEGELTPSLKLRVRDVLARASGYVDAVYEPTAACDCHFLRKVLRLSGDDRRCFAGHDRTLAQCHECAGFIFDDASEVKVAGPPEEMVS